MEIIHAIQTVQNNQILINLPPEFSGKEVEIIISLKKATLKAQKSLRGALGVYANPDRRSLESQAWAMVMEDKYGDRRR